jgi:[1-hydroxy-2-(trimethylamino)ethyl]phosphonate dioxygenase
MNVTTEIFELFQTRGQSAYFGEGVSQIEHALQAAWLAERSQASRALVVAALLHDIGHLIHGLPENIADQGIDGSHETAGGEWLARHFGPAVTEPIRLHVDAKRYLVYSDASYRARLSPASLQSLALQGGSCTPAEARELEANPFFQDAISLRRWDDAAKIPGLVVPQLEEYRDRIENLVVSR